jgi:hypothetical protein
MTRIAFIHLLEKQREIYQTPLGWGRFRHYLSALRGDNTNDLAIPPLTTMNPMAKGHMNVFVEALIESNVESHSAAACRKVESRLPLGLDLKLSLVAVDDVAGGWTNRYFNEMALLMPPVRPAPGTWLMVPCWAGESWDEAKVRRETLKAAFRAHWRRHHGLPATLGDLMAQEGAAGAFAEQDLTLPPQILLDAACCIRPHKPSAAYPVIMACMYGDAAAASLGYPELGLPAYAGFEVALYQAAAAPS